MNKAPGIELLLFHRDHATSARYITAGIDGVIVDLESAGKSERQSGFDTQINYQSLEDLARLREAHPKGTAWLMCRLSGPEASDTELAQVCAAGADEIIVPMITGLAQAERICALTRGRCDVMAMCETLSAVPLLAQLDALPVRRLYVGLTDLWIARGSETIFSPLVDGLMPSMRARVRRADFGFGGLTLPHRGAPLPSRHLYNELADAGAGFTFLRRSFYRDAADMAPEHALKRMRQSYAHALARTQAQIEADRVAARTAILALPRHHHAL